MKRRLAALTASLALFISQPAQAEVTYYITGAGIAVPLTENYTENVRIKTIIESGCRVGITLCNCLDHAYNHVGMYSLQSAMIIFSIQTSGCPLPKAYQALRQSAATPKQ